jgi:hypothetical protein
MSSPKARASMLHFEQADPPIMANVAIDTVAGTHESK